MALSSSSGSSLNSCDFNQLVKVGIVDLGKRVCYLTKKESAERRGVLRYVGEPEFASGLWVGVELDQPVGKNNGSLNGIRYFSCEENHGIFVRAERVELDNRPPPKMRAGSRPNSRPGSRPPSRPHSREQSPFMQRKRMDLPFVSGRSEVDGLSSSRSLPQIPPVSVVPDSDLDHLLKALKPDIHVITTATPKKYPRGPMKVFPMRTTRDGAQSVLDKNNKPKDNIKRSQSSSQLLSDREKSTSENKPIRRLKSASTVKATSPKSPKRERNVTNGASKSKGGGSPKKPKINMPLVSMPRSSSTPKDSQDVSADINPSEKTGSSHTLESPSPSRSSSPMLSSSIAPDSYTETPTKLERDIAKDTFMQTLHSNLPVQGSVVSGGVPLHPNTRACAVEHRTIDLYQPQVLVSNTNSNNSTTASIHPTQVGEQDVPSMETITSQFRGRVGQGDGNPPNCPVPQSSEAGNKVKYTNRRSGASMQHPLSTASCLPQVTGSPTSEDAFSTDSGHVPSNDMSSGHSSPTNIHSPGPDTSCPTCDLQSPSFEDSSHNLSLTRILSESNYDELAELPHEELLSTFKKEYLKNKEKIRGLQRKLKKCNISGSSSSRIPTPQQAKADLLQIQGQIKRDYKQQRKQMQKAHDSEIVTMEARHRAEYQEAVSRLEREQNVEIDVLKKAFGTIVAELEQKHSEEKSRLRKKHDLSIHLLKDELKGTREHCDALEGQIQLYQLMLNDTEEDWEESVI